MSPLSFGFSKSSSPISGMSVRKGRGFGRANNPGNATIGTTAAGEVVWKFTSSDEIYINSNRDVRILPWWRWWCWWWRRR